MTKFLERVRRIRGSAFTVESYNRLTGLRLNMIKDVIKHWIEHSREHCKKYEEWAKKIEKENPEVADLIRKAVEKFREGERILEDAYNRL